MVRIIIMITSTPLIATRIKNARGLDDGPEAPPPGCVGEAVALCCVGEAVAPCCAVVVFDAGDAPVGVDIGELEEGPKLDWATPVVPGMLGVVGPVSEVGVGKFDNPDLIGFTQSGCRIWQYIQQFGERPGYSHK